MNSMTRFFNRKHPQLDGLTLGQQLDGRPVVLPWPSMHVLCSGASGSGKSGWVNSIVYQAASRADTAIIAVDLKEGMELDPWTPRLTDLATNPAEATDTLTRLNELIESRCQLMRGKQRMWTTNLGPWVLFLIDEYAELSDLDPTLLSKALDIVDADRKQADSLIREAKTGKDARRLLTGSMARRARAAGVVILVATQYPTTEVIDSQVRTNTIIRIQGYVPSEDQIDIGLGNGQAEHIKPGTIAADEPGVAHVLGWAGYHKPRLAKASYVTDTDVAAHAAATAHYRYEWRQLLADLDQPAA